MKEKSGKKVLFIHPKDNVGVALTDLKEHESVNNKEEHIILREDIPCKHKFFKNDLKKGEPVYMYGMLVGTAIINIARGSRMTVDNTDHAAATFKLGEKKYTWEIPVINQFKERTFSGYHRSSGKVGTANYWIFIPTVFCENRNLDVIKAALHDELGYTSSDKYKNFTKELRTWYLNGGSVGDFPVKIEETTVSVKKLFENVDGIKFLNHHGGCGGTRQDAQVLSRLLAGYADHPNVAGITVLSLGCQHLQVEHLVTDLKKLNPKFDKPLHIFEQQKSKGEEQLIRDAIKQTFISLIEINKITRTPAPLSHLAIGVKCGASDGFSGISANPAVGYASDLIVALGGTILMGEFPELCGAEQMLIDRMPDTNTANKFIQLMNEYSAQAQYCGSGFHMNPSPGNIKDGLITDAIKSAGAAQKGGTSPITDVLEYADRYKKPGLNLVCTPGNDVEATTGLTAAGATLILFTTGLGTPTGNPVCPVIKLSTNSRLANEMSDIIDIDTGGIITGETTIEEVGCEILEYCINAASGIVKPKSVQLQQDDFIPWKRGVSL